MITSNKVQTFGRLIYIEPNELVNYAGVNTSSLYVDDKGEEKPRISTMAWNPEDLNMSVDLQVVLPSRNTCGQFGQNKFLAEITIDKGKDVNEMVSFLMGSEIETPNGGKVNELTTSYLEASYHELWRSGKSNTESLGIDSIDITFDQHFYPVVNIKFIDVRGYSLMMPTEDQYRSTLIERDIIKKDRSGIKYSGSYTNFFRAVFHFPYPMFLLTVKGYFGNSITFMLAVNEFKNSFNSQTGNFEIDISFIGYMYGLYTDLPMDFLLAAPYYDADVSNVRTSEKYWDSNNKLFFDSGDRYNAQGGRICTFAEFIEKFANLKLAGAPSSIKKVEDCENKLKYIADALSSLRTFISSFKETPQDYDTSITKIFDVSDSGSDLKEPFGVIWFTESGNSNDVVFTDAQIKWWKDFVTKINLVKDAGIDVSAKGFLLPIFESGTTTFETDDRNILEKQKFSSNYNLYVIDKSSKAGCRERTDSQEIQLSDIANLNPYVANRINNEVSVERKTGKTYYIITAYLIKKLNDEVNKINSEKQKGEQDIEEEQKTLYLENLGFEPFILNVYRMIFAHVDCFMSEYYNCLQEIDTIKTMRVLSNFKLNDKIIDSDLPEDNVPETGFIPPFPAFYRDSKDGRGLMEMIYPGELLGEVENLQDLMPEINLTEKLLNAAIGVKNKYRKAIEKLKEAEQAMEQANNAESTVTYPTMVSDVMLSSSPYKSIMGSTGIYDEKTGAYNNLPFTQALITMLLRWQMFKMQMSGNIKKMPGGTKDGKVNYGDYMDSFSNVEALNFLSVFSTPTQIFTNEIKTFYSKEGTNEITDNAFSTVFDFVSKKQNILVTKIKQNKILGQETPFSHCYSKNELPIYFNYILSKNSGVQYYETGSSGNTIHFTTVMAKDKDGIINSLREGIDNLKAVDNDGGYDKAKDCSTNFRDLLSNSIVNFYFDSSRKDVYLCSMLSWVGPDIKLDINNYTFKDIDKQNTFKDSWYKSQKEIYKILLFLVAYTDFLYVTEFQDENLRGIHRALLFNEKNDWTDSILTKVSMPIALLLGAMSACITDGIIKADGKNVMADGKEGDFFDKFIKGKGLVVFFRANDAALYDNRTGEDKVADVLYGQYVKSDTMKFFKNIFEDFKRKNGERVIEIISNSGNYVDGGTTLKEDKLEELKNLINPNEYYYYYNIHADGESGSDCFSIVECKSLMGGFLNRILLEWGEIETEEDRRKDDMKVSDATILHKRSLYKALKILHDKWINSYSLENFKLPDPSEDRTIRERRYVTNTADIYNERKEFDNFLFVDAYQKDLSYLLKINPATMLELISRQFNAESNSSMYEFIHELMQKNRVLLQALPVYNNYYSRKTIADIFTPHPKDIMKTGYGSTYVCMYVYEVSHVVSDESYVDGGFCNDGFDLCGITDDPQPDRDRIFGDNISGDTIGLSFKVPAFGVTYGRQNQTYFKNISVNMDNPRMTDYSIANLFSLGNLKKPSELGQTNTVGQDIYNIYANRSYNCSVDMMGCANIMPMMYFQLNNIPMFRGAYMISNVEHHIRAGEFTTRFTGVRINKNQLPYGLEEFNYWKSQEDSAGYNSGTYSNNC